MGLLGMSLSDSPLHSTPFHSVPSLAQPQPNPAHSVSALPGYISLCTLTARHVLQYLLTDCLFSSSIFSLFLVLFYLFDLYLLSLKVTICLESSIFLLRWTQFMLAYTVYCLCIVPIYCTLVTILHCSPFCTAYMVHTSSDIGPTALLSLCILTGM